MSDLEAAFDELYGSAPADFVAVRKQLAAALGAAGDRDAAKELREARRPSTSAWALNQMARLQPDVVAELLDRGADLVAAQTRALSGSPEKLRAAIGAHRDALDLATDAALGILGPRANDGFRGEVVSTLRAASTDEEVGRTLRAGRVVREVSAPGFPDATGLTLVSSPKPGARKDRPSAANPAAARDEAAEAREREAAAERELEARRQAERAAREAARRAAAAADRDAERARGRIERLQCELDAAQHELAAALERARAANAEAEAP